MAQLKDRTGIRYGHLVALEYKGNSNWLCQCDCGKQKIAAAEADAAAKLKEAEAQKAIAAAEAEALLVKAQAEAEANKVLSESITPELLEKLYADRWDGKLPSVIGNGDYILPSDIFDTKE